MDKGLRIKDIEGLIKGLDITPTMFKNAKEKYENLANHLRRAGLEVDIFPQGSFSIGTVVRPYRDSKDCSYDLDFLCVSAQEKNKTTPKAVKYEAYNVLVEDAVYENLLCKKEYDKCWTLEYAKISDIDFNMDIVPAVKEDRESALMLMDRNLSPEYAALCHAITNKDNNNYSWCTSNPKGYKLWFEDINKPFLEFNRRTRLESIFIENRNLYGSVEEIPYELERSNLQRVIQLLKRHRDVYFSKLDKNYYKYRPISALITTITAEIARSASPYISILDLLQYVVSEFQIYGEKQHLSEDKFYKYYPSKNLIKRENGLWEYYNPVNPKDNLLDGWNDNSKYAKFFFQWVSQVKKDFITSLNEADNRFLASLENGLGGSYVQSNLDKKHYNFKAPEIITSTPKLWRI